LYSPAKYSEALREKKDVTITLLVRGKAETLSSQGRKEGEE